MKKEADHFEGVEPSLIFVAKRLNDALALEGVLDAAGIDYGVEPDEYLGGTIFKSRRVGAFFYVRPEARESAVAAMIDKGYVPVQ